MAIAPYMRPNHPKMVELNSVFARMSGEIIPVRTVGGGGGGGQLQSNLFRPMSSCYDRSNTKLATHVMPNACFCTTTTILMIFDCGLLVNTCNM